MPTSAIVLMVLVSHLAAARPSLTPADIEQATGLKGVHRVPETTKGAVPGRLWFHDFTAQGFERAKAQPAKMMGAIEIEPKLFHAAVPGLGDEAFDSPDGTLQHALYVRKGQAAFGLIANVGASGRGDKPTVTMAQLKALAKIVLSRM